MNKKQIVFISLLLLTLNISIGYSLLQYIMTIEGYGKCEVIPQLIEVYEDKECTIELSSSSLIFPEFNKTTGVEQTLDFYIKNNLDKDVSIYWRLNPNIPTLKMQDMWSDRGNGYSYNFPSQNNGWFLQLYWNYPNEYMQTNKEYGTKILHGNEVHKLTVYLRCPYNARVDIEFIIDIIATEI